jgi:hypothetical protein
VFAVQLPEGNRLPPVVLSDRPIGFARGEPAQPSGLELVQLDDPSLPNNQWLLTCQMSRQGPQVFPHVPVLLNGAPAHSAFHMTPLDQVILGETTITLTGIQSPK